MVAKICSSCGYSSLDDLVSANSDYVVDGLCNQLRQLQAFPRAPYLFTALLAKGSLGPKLLPLLAEPARIALKVPKHALGMCPDKDDILFLASIADVSKFVG